VRGLFGLGILGFLDLASRDDFEVVPDTLKNNWLISYLVRGVSRYAGLMHYHFLYWGGFGG
jgi:hypothetical protein